MMLLLGIACTDPTAVGAELLEQDQAEVAFTDTLTLSAVTIPGDSVLTYVSGQTTLRSDYYFGDMADPVFGRTVASFYLQPRLYINPSTGDLESPDFSDSQIDSVVLVLPLGLSGHYGNEEQPFGFEVLEVTEPISTSRNYYSNVTFATGQTLGGNVQTPNFDSVFVTKLFQTSGDTAVIQPHLRISLNEDFKTRLRAQDSLITSDSLWLNFLPGIMVRPTLSNNGLLNFKLANTWAGIYVFYTKDGERQEYVFPLRSTSPRISKYEHIRTGAAIEPFINSRALSDSLLFLQGLQGLVAELEIPSLSQLNNYAINRAVLEVSADILAIDDTSVYKLPPQLVVLKKNEDGELELIDDILLFDNDVAFHGGRLDARDGVIRYNLNIPYHLQYIVEGKEPNKLYLAISPVGSTPYRVVLRGHKRSESPIRLKLALTALQ